MQLCQNVFVAKPKILKVSLQTKSQMAVYSKIGNYLINIRMFLSESNVNNILINLPDSFGCGPDHIMNIL